jgi:hypothetical protein
MATEASTLETQALVQQLMAENARLLADNQAGNTQLAALQTEMASLQTQLATLQTRGGRVAATTSAPSASSSSTLPAGVKPALPANYSGKNNSESLEAWLFSIESYFRMTGVSLDSQKIDLAGSLLRGPASVWHRNVCSDLLPDEFRVHDWSEFKQELRDNFVTTNPARLAREKFYSIRQSGDLREYVREFRLLMIELPELPEADKVFKFVSGLKQPMRKELVEKDPQTLLDAFKLAERVDVSSRSYSGGGYSGAFGFRNERPRQSFGRSPQPYRGHRGDSRRDDPMHLDAVGFRGRASTPARGRTPSRASADASGTRHEKLTPELREKLMREQRCLYCREQGHFIKDCPKIPKGSRQGNGSRDRSDSRSSSRSPTRR